MCKTLSNRVDTPGDPIVVLHYSDFTELPTCVIATAFVRLYDGGSLTMATRTYGTRPLPWPFRLLGWLFSATLVLLIMAATVAAVMAISTSAYYELTRTKSGEMDGMIDKRLPVGSSPERIYAVLDEEGIEHGTVQPFPGDDLELLYAGVKAGTPVIIASVRNEGYSLELVEVQIAFVLDENGMLKDHVVYERHHQPEWLDRNLEALKP
jgi:hypothetical protein